MVPLRASARDRFTHARSRPGRATGGAGSVRQRVCVLNLVIPAKAGIHRGLVNTDFRVRGNDE